MIAECIWRLFIKSPSGAGFEASIRATSPQEAEEFGPSWAIRDTELRHRRTNEVRHHTPADGQTVLSLTAGKDRQSHHDTPPRRKTHGQSVLVQARVPRQKAQRRKPGQEPVQEGQ
jgi:hypothetical protein